MNSKKYLSLAALAGVILIISAVSCSKKHSSSNTSSGSGTTPPPEVAVSTFSLTVAKIGDGTGAVSSTPSGIDCGTDCSENYADQTNVTLHAVPSNGTYSFSGWTGDCTGTGDCVIKMTANKSVKAAFVKEQRLLTVAKSGAGAGTVTSSPDGISCGSDCNELYALNTSVTLSAAPDGTSLFTGWSGACSGTGNCVLTISDVKNVTANFDKAMAHVAITKSGDGSGTVSSSPSGISCGATCSADFVVQTVLTLTASPSDGQSSFVGWGGACSGTAVCVLTIDQAKNVTASFGLLKKTLTVVKTGAGAGTVTSNPSGITCGDGGTACSEDILFNAAVALTATPADATSAFLSWSGACTGTGVCSLTMDQAKNVTASFGQVKRTLTVSKTGLGSGTVTSNPAGITCGNGGTVCTEDILLNSAVTLTATPTDAASEFLGWSGDCSGTGACTITMAQVRNASANFGQVKKTLTVVKSGAGTGTVTSSPAGISCGSDCSKDFLYNTRVVLTQTQGNGYFTGWSGSCSGIAPCQIAMADTKNITATFDNVSVDGFYHGTLADTREMAVWVANNLVTTFGYVTGLSSSCANTVSYYYFYSGNSVANHQFNVSGSVTVNGALDTAYTASGMFLKPDEESSGCGSESENITWTAARSLPITASSMMFSSVISNTPPMPRNRESKLTVSR